jgi:cell division protein ZapA
VSTTKNAVRVIIGGEEYTVRSELPPEYTREVASYLDAALKRVRDSLPMVESHKAAILAALSITDELFQARQGDREAADRLSALANDLARLLPPAKRGSRVAS